MTAPPFTPGDWIADEEHLTVQTADKALDIAQVFDDGTCPAEQLKADLHLLAASKAMYEALQVLLEAAATGSANHLKLAESAARSAIDRAEGRR